MLVFFLSMLETPEEKQLFTKLYEENSDRMYSVALGILHDDFLAEDAVNQAFLKLIQGVRRFEDFTCNQIRNYLVIVVKSSAIDMYNKSHKIVEVPFDESFEVDGRYEDDTPNKLDHDELMGLIAQLPEIYSETLYMSIHMELTTNEIAHSLSLSVSAVKLRLMRARLKLRDMLEGIEA